MKGIVTVPKIVPVAPFWFENVQFAWGKAPGPQYPRGTGNARS